MLDKISLDEKEYDNLTKGLAAGVGIGIIIGACIGNVTLAFAAGGVIGIVSSLIYSYFTKAHNTSKVSNKILTK